MLLSFDSTVDVVVVVVVDATLHTSFKCSKADRHHKTDIILNNKPYVSVCLCEIAE